MKYMTVKEASKLWDTDISTIGKLLRAGKIEGASKLGGHWVIPRDMTKPIDGRTKAAKVAAKEVSEDNIFRFRIYDKRDIDAFSPPLSYEERVLHEAISAFLACRFEKATEILGDLPNCAKNPYYRFYALSLGCLLCIFQNRKPTFFDYYGKLTDFFDKKCSHKTELWLLFLEFNSIFGDTQQLANEFSIDSQYSYHPDFIPRLASLCSIVNYFTLSALPNKNCVDILELQAIGYEGKAEYAVESQTMHMYIGLINETLGKSNEKDYHFRRAFELAEQYELYWLPALDYCYMGASLGHALTSYSAAFSKKIRSLSAEIERRFKTFLGDDSSLTILFGLIPKKKYSYVHYALLGYSNLEVAKVMHISERAVKQNYSLIYETLGISSKKELVSLCQSISNRRKGKFEHFDL